MVADFSSVSSSQRVLILPDGVPHAYVTLPDSIYLDTLDTSDFVTCFAADTGIATALGDRPVETLRIGDKITTADGRQVRVKWIGRQTILGSVPPACCPSTCAPGLGAVSRCWRNPPPPERSDRFPRYTYETEPSIFR